MKEIMAKVSSNRTQGVPSFSYIPAEGLKQGLLFDLTQPLADLEESLLKDFAGRTISMKKLYEEHSVDKPYILKNYKDVLLKLESEGRIKTEPPKEKRRRETFSDKVEITFLK